MFAIFVAHTAYLMAINPVRHEFLTLDEIRRISTAFAELGTEKVRITGGEPTMRKDFSDIIAAINENDAIKK